MLIYFPELILILRLTFILIQFWTYYHKEYIVIKFYTNPFIIFE